jgi:ubiquinone/menaquinone biosynthesis C-methylase UbiE
LELNPTKRYDAEMIGIRLGYIEKYGSGKDVLDLCCGSGAYLLPSLPRLRSAIGLDFSRNLLMKFQKQIDGRRIANLKLVEGDAQKIPLKDNLVDFVFSFCALYYLPRLESAVSEVSRVLRPGGFAALECGNSISLNMPVTQAFHEESGWAKPHYFPRNSLMKWLDKASLEILQHRAFQFLPMYGTPRRLLPLMPLLSPKWKTILGAKVRGKMLDEWISNSWPMNRVAFRHMFLVRKS